MPRHFAHLSDEALVALAARSEQSALAELYDRYGRTAYGLALRVLRDHAEASRMGRAGGERVECSFDVRHTASAYEDLYLGAGDGLPAPRT